MRVDSSKKQYGKNYHVWTEDHIRQIHTLYYAGEGYGKIANILKLRPLDVQRYLKEQGMTRSRAEQLEMKKRANQNGLQC